MPTDDKVDVPIKVTLDSSDIKKLVKDEVNSVLNNSLLNIPFKQYLISL